MDETPDNPRELTAPVNTGKDAVTGRFLPGNTLTHTRGPGGRSKALRTLDQMLASEENQRILKEAMQKSFRQNPMRFFRTIIMPLLPREARLEMENEGRVLWTRISEAFPAEEEAEPETIDVAAL